MSAYQLLKQFQDEVERMTGLRPHVDISFYSHYTGFGEQKAESIRDTLVTDSENAFITENVPLSDEGLENWTVFKGRDVKNNIEICVHGPNTKEGTPCQESA